MSSGEHLFAAIPDHDPAGIGFKYYSLTVDLGIFLWYIA